MQTCQLTSLLKNNNAGHSTELTLINAFYMPKRCKIFQVTVAILLLVTLQTNGQELAVANKSRNNGNIPASRKSNDDILFLVKGTVSDATGALAGVTVTEKGTSNATSTDNNGRFSINVASST